MTEQSPTQTKPLYGHSSFETAYHVADYPYSFKLRCEIWYWLEYKPTKGFRFVSQTKNPKNGVMNKPKTSTYIDFGANMYLDENYHVHWTGVGVYTSAQECYRFLKRFPNTLALTPFIDWTKTKYKYERLVSEEGVTPYGKADEKRIEDATRDMRLWWKSFNILTSNNEEKPIP